MTELRTRDIPLNWDVDESWLPRIEPKAGTMRAPLVADLVERERELIEDALRKSAGTVSGRTGAAAKLGIPRQTLGRRSGRWASTGIASGPFSLAAGHSSSMPKVRRMPNLRLDHHPRRL